MNSWKNLFQVSASICFLCIAFFIPSLATTILFGVAGFATYSIIFVITNIQDVVVPNSNENIITSAVEELIDSNDYNSEEVIYQTQTCDVISSISAIFMDKMKQSSSEMQSLDAEPPASSKLEDELLSVCPEREDETTKDMNLICPSVTKSSEMDSEVSLAEEIAEDVHHIFPSLTNPLKNMAEDDKVPVQLSDVLQASTTDEVSTGHPVISNDSDTILNEDRTTISEEKSRNIETEHIDGKHITKEVWRKFPLDTVPIEFIYPCLPYFHY